MALLWTIKRFHNVPRLCIKRLLPIFYSQGGEKTIDLEVDALDTFTSQLMQKKIEKWCYEERSLQEKSNSNINQTQKQEIDMKNLSSQELGAIIQKSIDKYDHVSIKNIVEVCVRKNTCPPLNTLLNAITICSQNGHKDSIELICDLCRIHHPELLKVHSDFRHFIAEATWARGNVPKAIQLFEEVYRQNAFLRRRIRLLLRNLIADLVSSRSEAVLWQIIGFSERIQRDFNDFYPLSCVWQACFLSEWYTDQKCALELLQRTQGLRKAVVPRIPYVVFVSLKCHRTEGVYRLLETLLKYEMKAQYALVLVALLDYQFRWGDYKSCSEIIRWATDNDVSLPENQQIRLLNLLLKKSIQKPLLAPKSKYDTISLKF